MNQLQRFKAAPDLDREGRLMSSGSQERPDPAAMQRVAQRLGISAAALASAAAATAVAPAASAATSGAAAGGVGTVGAVVGKTAGSVLAASVLKGTLIGLGLTIAVYSGARWVGSSTPANTPIASTAPAKVSKQPQRIVNDPGVAREPAVLQDLEPSPVAVQQVSPSSGSPSGAKVVEPPGEPMVAPVRGAAATARFEEFEPSVPVRSQKPGSTVALPSNGPASAAAGTPSAGLVPVDPRLAREVASLDRARGSANRGDATGALRELNNFERGFGYVTLRKEAMLVNIDVLLSLGRKAEATAIARQLLALGAPATQRAKLEALVVNQP